MSERAARERGRVPTSSRLTFRWWEPSDLALAKQLWDDPDVTARIGAVDAAARLTLEIEHAALGFQYWPIFEGAAFVGCAGLKPRDARVLELGFHLRPAFWGKGFATEAARAVIRFAFDAFDALDLRALFAGHHPENTASRGVLLKLGFRNVGDELFPPTGRMHPGYLLER